MTAKHGTRSRFVAGCGCDNCTEADRIYKRDYRQRKASGESSPRRMPVSVVPPYQAEVSSGPGLVEAAVAIEISGLAEAEARPGLAAAALELARVMDSPRAVNQKAAASKALAEILDKLRKGADTRRSRLASVRQMTSAKSVTG